MHGVEPKLFPNGWHDDRVEVEVEVESRQAAEAEERTPPTCITVTVAPSRRLLPRKVAVGGFCSEGDSDSESRYIAPVSQKASAISWSGRMRTNYIDNDNRRHWVQTVLMETTVPVVRVTVGSAIRSITRVHKKVSFNSRLHRFKSHQRLRTKYTFESETDIV
ncbi:hypothetical protein BC827DRAFT_1325574 [Russula dissimulans]|nr:hypothetical protein BC827DRAFT_1325574 [Russula dissimulans]